jgi:hypothetical protein
MLAAIVPADQQAWFFKAVGEIAAIDQQAESIVEFYSSIHIDDTGRARWELPAGWKEDPPSGMRAATLWVPSDGKPIELTVTTLGWRGTRDELLGNVNRWRGQMQLPPISMEELPESTRELAAGNAKITLADLRGRYQASGMMGPFAGGAAGAASRAAQGPGAAIPPGHPPIDESTGLQPGGPQNAAAAANVPKFDVPSSWQQRPAANSMHKAEFGIADGAQQVRVTLSDFATNAGPSITDPLPNVNRWRRQIGLGEIAQDELDTVVEKMEIDDQPATYVRMVPDPEKPAESQIDQATLAAMVTKGDVIWFIKMTGTLSLVTAQEDEFKEFLQSIRFPAEAGANHGN